MNDELEEENKRIEVQNELLKNSEGVTPMFQVRV